MLVDEIIVQLEAGHGGKGAVEFNRTKMSLGPVGGSGGKGGSIYLKGVADIGALGPYANRKKIKAEPGRDGRGQLTDGHAGKDLFLTVPIGTRVVNVTTDEVHEINQVDEELLIAAGGKGGRGNYLFRSSANTTPTKFQNGLPGDVVKVRLELRLIASVGLIGLPNAGKSSLLNELTSARSRIGSYPFTTLEPSLGSYYGLIIADIPGLIEGASDGKGLGIKFLKHIERTETLFHLVSVESNNVVQDYTTVREELKKYNPELLEKKEYVLLSHADAATPDDLQDKLQQLKAASSAEVFPISIIDDDSLHQIKKVLNTIKDSK